MALPALDRRRSPSNLVALGDRSGQRSGASSQWLLRGAPPWLSSLVLHAVLLVVLSLLSFQLARSPSQTFLVAPTEGPPAAPPAVLAAVTTALTGGAVDVDHRPPSTGMMAVSGPKMTIQSPLGWSSLGDLSDLAVSARDMLQENPTTEGATFFGSQALGTRIAFVVDNSNSMRQGRLATALLELERSIEDLNERQQFFVVFFSDTAYAQFHPRPEREMIPATPANKERLFDWLQTVQRCRGTRALSAIRMAAALKPDVIYVLSDGKFTDETADVLCRRPIPDLTLNTLGMGVVRDVKREYRTLAERHGGKFHDVGVTSEGLADAKLNPRPSNRIRGSVWGIAIPNKRPRLF